MKDIKFEIICGSMCKPHMLKDESIDQSLIDYQSLTEYVVIMEPKLII